VADVTNYTIENASGANVRIDLNNVFAAIQSLNSKSTDLSASQCVAGMPFLNTANNILKIRNSSNTGFTDIGNINTANLGLLPAAGGTMTGALLGHDGAGASAPAFSFDGDTDLGLFRKSANIMGFASSGTEQMVFDANGITLRTQNEVRFGDADSSNYIAIKPPATVSANKTITLPVETGTLLTSVTAIATSQLSGTVFTLGSTTVAQGNTVTALPGLHQVTPASNNQYSLGTDALRWSDIFTNDLNLSNEGGQNDIDGTWGSYKIQEGEEHLYLINKRNGKKYKFNLTEVT
tara:strand:+ start:1205 stop:2083 length:879 start_codon:yes stop_codon:yes gene_type:complete